MLSRNPGLCILNVSSDALQQVEKFRYLGVVFVSDGRQHKIDRRTS